MYIRNFLAETLHGSTKLANKQRLCSRSYRIATLSHPTLREQKAAPTSVPRGASDDDTAVLAAPGTLFSPSRRERLGNLPSRQAIPAPVPPGVGGASPWGWKAK